MILLIDNYDSFTYNLYQYMGIFEKDIKVVRNDKMTIKEIEQLNPDRIVLSPGPKSPKEAGICIEVVKHFYQKKPILGICLGHQSIGAAFVSSRRFTNSSDCENLSSKKFDDVPFLLNGLIPFEYTA